MSQVDPKGPPTFTEQFHEYKELGESDMPSGQTTMNSSVWPKCFQPDW